MTKRQNTGADKTRGAIAREAARILVAESVDSPYQAKRRAIDRLQLPANSPLPSNAELEAAVEEYQQNSYTQSHHQLLLAQRKVACEAMRYLQRFKPRIVAGALSATALPGVTIELHLFADSIEEVGFELMQNRIPYELTEKTYHLGKSGRSRQPALSFLVDQFEVLLVVFPGNRDGYPPVPSKDREPVKTIGLAELENLTADAKRQAVNDSCLPF